MISTPYSARCPARKHDPAPHRRAAARVERLPRHHRANLCGFHLRILSRGTRVLHSAGGRRRRLVTDTEHQRGGTGCRGGWHCPNWTHTGCRRCYRDRHRREPVLGWNRLPAEPRRPPAHAGRMAGHAAVLVCPISDRVARGRPNRGRLGRLAHCHLRTGRKSPDPRGPISAAWITAYRHLSPTPFWSSRIRPGR